MDKQKRGGLCSNIAILSTDLNQHTREDGWRMLFPAGYFRANDGRPFEPHLARGWYMDGEVAAQLTASLAFRGQDIVGDYEHTTLKVKEKGGKNPASAWLNHNETKWIEGKGFYIRPRWQPEAKAALDSQAYRFLSPVFGYDDSGHPTFIHSFALTNDPGLPNMDELVALASSLYATPKENENNESNPPINDKENPLMDEHLKTILELLQIEVIDEDFEAAAVKAKELIAELQSKAKDAEEKEKTIEKKDEEIAALSSQNGIDPTLHVPIALYNAARDEIAALSSTAGGMSVESMISKARQEGKISNYEIDYLKSVGTNQGIAALSSMLQHRKPMVALESTQVTQEILDAAEKVVDDELTPEQLKIMEEMGISKEEFLKHLLEQKDKGEQA